MDLVDSILWLSTRLNCNCRLCIMTFPPSLLNNIRFSLDLGGRCSSSIPHVLSHTQLRTTHTILLHTPPVMTLYLHNLSLQQYISCRRQNEIRLRMCELHQKVLKFQKNVYRFSTLQSAFVFPGKCQKPSFLVMILDGCYSMSSNVNQ